MAAIFVVLVPLILFGVELMIVAIVVVGGVVARSALGRPWIVLAIPKTDPAKALAWEVKGWRRSEELIERVAAELSAGVAVSQIRKPKQGGVGLS